MKTLLGSVLIDSPLETHNVRFNPKLEEIFL